jgi:hypothetical protein
MALGDDSHKYVRVYKAPPLINWGDPRARLVWLVMREGLSTVHDRREREAMQVASEDSKA